MVKTKRKAKMDPWMIGPYVLKEINGHEAVIQNAFAEGDVLRVHFGYLTRVVIDPSQLGEIKEIQENSERDEDFMINNIQIVIGEAKLPIYSGSEDEDDMQSQEDDSGGVSPNGDVLQEESVLPVLFESVDPRWTTGRYDVWHTEKYAKSTETGVETGVETSGAKKHELRKQGEQDQT